MSISPLEIILRKENNHLNFPLRRSFVQEDLTGIDNQSEIKTNESFKKGFRNSFKRLSLRKKPIKEVQDSEIKDKGLLNLCRRAALLEDSNEFLSGLKKVKEAQLDRISSKQNPLIDVNQKIKGDYLLMKPVPVSTSKMWAERIQLWIKELKKPDDSCYQYMN